MKMAKKAKALPHPWLKRFDHDQYELEIVAAFLAGIEIATRYPHHKELDKVLSRSKRAIESAQDSLSAAYRMANGEGPPEAGR